MVALDTKVLIYACDKADPERQQIALDLVSGPGDGVLLWQVACEFVAASRKLKSQGFTNVDAWNRLADYLAIFPLILPVAGAQRLRRSPALPNIPQNSALTGNVEDTFDRSVDIEP